jgi:hypothetical protein
MYMYACIYFVHYINKYLMLTYFKRGISMYVDVKAVGEKENNTK